MKSKNLLLLTSTLNFLVRYSLFVISFYTVVTLFIRKEEALSGSESENVDWNTEYWKRVGEAEFYYVAAKAT